jgi:hypothetical protein
LLGFARLYGRSPKDLEAPVCGAGASRFSKYAGMEISGRWG